MLKAGDAVVLGLSGGPDSVFLFHQLLDCGRPLKIIACHVNYHLRGRASDADQQFVEKLCRKHHVSLEISSARPQSMKGNLENNCRLLRYRFFEKIRRRYRAACVMVAHQQNDQVETFLLNLLRGSSLKGFWGMSDYDPQRKLCRPLLDITKKEILQWLKKKRLSFRVDRSNSSGRFSRNQIRAKVIPLLEKINPNFITTAGLSIRELSGHLAILDDLGQQWLDTNLHSTAAKIHFDLTDFLALPESLCGIVLRILFIRLNGQSLTRQTLGEIIKTLGKNRSGLKKEFGDNTFLKIEKDPKNQKRVVVIERKVH